MLQAEFEPVPRPILEERPAPHKLKRALYFQFKATLFSCLQQCDTAKGPEYTAACHTGVWGP